MPIHDLKSERLYLEDSLSEGIQIDLGRDQAHYLLNVMRLAAGREFLVFNGRDGEWRARIGLATKRSAMLEIINQVRPQASGPDIEYIFAPLKHARLDYMVQKAVELGVSCLSPVMTRRTVPERVNLARMRANAIEAAEQCGILRIPRIESVLDLAGKLDAWPSSRPLIFCDEGGTPGNPIEILGRISRGPVGVIVGPEGGFDHTERERLCGMACVLRLSLGPRIMRADTAAVAVLALVNATVGDWKSAV